METRLPLEILIGDDMFLMPIDAIMAQNQYLEPLKEKIKNYDVRFIVCINTTRNAD